MVKIESVINNRIDSGRENVLNFIAHLRECENISLLSDENDEGRWWIRDKEKLLCEIQISAVTENSPGGWDVWFYGDCIGGHDSPADMDVKEIAWKNITYCGNCGADCAPGRQKTVFGRRFENVCQSTLGFSNPDVQTLDCMKMIIEIM